MGDIVVPDGYQEYVELSEYLNLWEIVHDIEGKPSDIMDAFDAYEKFKNTDKFNIARITKIEV